MSGVVSFPIPAYSNLPIQPQFYAPSRFEIDDIAKGRTTVVTTTVDHNYVIGQLVRITIPAAYGMYQINENQGIVVTIPSTKEVEIQIDSTSYDSYIAATNANVPQILAIGGFNYGIISTNGRVVGSTNIPGSFINISPE
jgi:hypothetical protein